MAVKTSLYTGETIGLMVFSAILGAGAMYFFNKKKNGLNDFGLNYGGGGVLMPGPPLPQIPTGPKIFSPVYNPIMAPKVKTKPKRKMPDITDGPYDWSGKKSPGADPTGGAIR